jgi:hypothetical protein
MKLKPSLLHVSEGQSAVSEQVMMRPWGIAWTPMPSRLDSTAAEMNVDFMIEMNEGRQMIVRRVS